MATLSDTDLPPASYYHLLYTLRGALPPPLTDDPEDLRRRDQAALARPRSYRRIYCNHSCSWHGASKSSL